MCKTVLQANVNSTQEIVELSLNTTRNALLVLDLKVRSSDSESRALRVT